jgi:cytosine/adenosine deaminase-related metal-dependent hydrolase
MTRTAFVEGVVLTMDDAGTVIPDGTVLVEDRRIVAVGGAEVDVTGAEVVDCRSTLVLPGFVNAHTHVSQTLLRGGPGHSRALYDWLTNVVIPGLAAYTETDLRLAVQLYCAEATRAGITTVIANEEPVAETPERAARTVLDTFVQCGMRTRYCWMFRDQMPEAVADEPGVHSAGGIPASAGELDATFESIQRLGAEYRSMSHGLVDVWPSPATTAVVSVTGLRRSAELAEHAAGMWTLHLAEIPLEQQLRGSSPVRHLDELGLLSDRLLAAHCVHVDGKDIHALARARCGVVTNPVSNCFLGSGVAPAIEMAMSGVRLGLGTDDANCNDSVNPLSDMKTLALIQRGTRQDPVGLDPETVVRASTAGGAQAAGLTDVGVLEPGRAADLQVISLDEPQLVPLHDPYAALVFQAYGNEVRDVMVDGRFTLRNRTLTAEPDLRALCRAAAEASAHILHRAGIPATRRVSARRLRVER